MKHFVCVLFLSISLSSFLQDLKDERQLDSNYIYLLDSLIKKDQFVRNRKHSKANLYFLKSSNDKRLVNSIRFKKSLVLRNEWLKIDYSNIQTLLQLIELKGFPSVDRVGERAYLNAQLLLLHFDEDTNNRILKPILTKYLKSGEIFPSDYARIIDRHHSRDGKQVYYEWRPCLYELLSNQEKERVSQARKEIGLKPKVFKCSTFGKIQTID
jgi:hypothetical protein